MESSSFNSRVWSPLPESEYPHAGLSRIEKNQLDPVSMQALECASQAIAMAGLPQSAADPKTGRSSLDGLDSSLAGCWIGTGVGGVSTIAQALSHQILRQPAAGPGFPEDATGYFRYPKRFNPFTVPMLMPNAPAANVAIKLGLQGPVRTPVAACASGTIAIGEAFRAVSDGRVDLALAGGSEHLFDEYGTVFRGFDAIGALVHGDHPPETLNRPFDRGRSGFLFSQGGAAVLVLEEYNRARDRGATIFAELAGYAEGCEASSIMAPAPDGAVMERVLREAVADAGLAPEEIGYINAHGTGTEANDRIEAGVIGRLFGRTTPVAATKGLTGHTIGAAGALEAVVTVLSLYRGITPGCRNLADPEADLAFLRESGPLAATAALSQSFAFGGHDAALVFRRG